MNYPKPDKVIPGQVWLSSDGDNTYLIKQPIPNRPGWFRVECIAGLDMGMKGSWNSKNVLGPNDRRRLVGAASYKECF